MIEFVVTGVCRPGQNLNLHLPKLLAQAGEVVLWIDFKQATDFLAATRQVAVEAPEVTLAVAPRAMWGGPSIVGTMLEAVAFSLQRSERWQQLVFCSILDTALADPPTVASYIATECAYDYCGGRFNASTWELLPDFEQTPTTEDALATREWAVYPVRPEMSVRVETALASIFRPKAVRSLRLCDSMHQRYSIGVWEDFTHQQLSLHRLTRQRAADRLKFFSEYGLWAGKQFCILSRRFSNTLLTPAVIDLYHEWFCDILIPDECFFQTVARHYELTGSISAKWQNIFYAEGYRGAFHESVREQRQPHELLGRF
jgi:hypothetical protein